MIANVINWQDLGIFLGLDGADIERISSNYEPREHCQWLVETWFARDPNRSWKKLHKAIEEASARRESQMSQYSFLSTPTSPMGEFNSISPGKSSIITFIILIDVEESNGMSPVNAHYIQTMPMGKYMCQSFIVNEEL